MAYTLEEVSSEYARLEEICEKKKLNRYRDLDFYGPLETLRSRFNTLAESDKNSDRGKQLGAAITELRKTCYENKPDPYTPYEGEEDETEGAVAGGAGKGKRTSRKSRNQRKRRSHTRRKYRRTTKS